MAASRKQVAARAPSDAPVAVGLRDAAPHDAPVSSGARALQHTIEAHYLPPQSGAYPGALKILILAGGATASWIMVGSLVVLGRHIFH